MSQLLTKAECLTMIKRAKVGTCFMLRIRNDAPIVNAESYFPAGLSTYVNVSRKQAERVVGSMLSANLETRGARIPVDVDGLIFWFGA